MEGAQKKEILEKLNFSKSLVRFAEGDIYIPLIKESYNSVNEKWYAHPPCIIPLFTDYGLPQITGILYHPFSNRNKSFISYDLETEYFIEKARNENQLYTKMVLEMDMIAEELTNDIITFCNALPYAHPKVVDDFAEKYGDNPESFSELIFFKEDMPLAYCKNHDLYKGDFPTSSNILKSEKLNEICSYELAYKSILSGVNNVPTWLSNRSDQKTLFEDYLKEGSLEKAWMTLNSKGLSLEETAYGLSKIQEYDESGVLQLVAENWIEGWKTSL